MVFSDYVKVLPVLRDRLFPFVVDVAGVSMGDCVRGCSLVSFGSSDIKSGSRDIWLCLKFDYMDECSSLDSDSFLRSFRESLMLQLSDVGVVGGLNLLDLFNVVFDGCSVELMTESVFRVRFVVRSDFSMSSFNDVCDRVVA